MMTPAVTWQSNPPEKLLKERFHISTAFIQDNVTLLSSLLVVSVKSGQVLGRRVSWSRVKSEQHSHSPFEKPLHV